MTLIDCLDHNFGKEVFGNDSQWKCDKCGNKDMNFKQYRLFNSPNTLVICIKRFEYNMMIGDFVKNNTMIDIPVCPKNYESIGDIASVGLAPNPENYRCLPEDCLEMLDMSESQKLYFNNKKKLHTFIQKKTDASKYNHLGEKGYNFFRYNEKDSEEDVKPLYKIKDTCLGRVPAKTTDDKFDRIGIGWHGRPMRNPKYSIFNYLSQFPEAIITSVTTGFKYYIIHTELFKNNSDPLAIYKTSAKNLYYVLTLNFSTGKYDRCLSVNTNKRKHKDRLILTRIRSEKESYWQIVINPNNPSEIRLKSMIKDDEGNDLYFYHDRSFNLRNKLYIADIHEKIVNIGKYRQELNRFYENPDIKESLIQKYCVNSDIKINRDDPKFDQICLDRQDRTLFGNIKSAYGTNVFTAIEKEQYQSKMSDVFTADNYKSEWPRPRQDAKFYKNEAQYKLPNHTYYSHPDRGIDISKF